MGKYCFPIKLINIDFPINYFKCVFCFKKFEFKPFEKFRQTFKNISSIHLKTNNLLAFRVKVIEKYDFEF